MECRPSSIPEVLLLTPRRHHDARGYFFEAYQQQRYQQVLGCSVSFVQDNVSCSRQHVLRGLHYQIGRAEQGKLVQVLQGAILDVAVDLRRGSPSFGRWTANRLDQESGVQCWIPPGFAHGFLTLSEQALVSYKTTAPYCQAAERGVRWNDPDLTIDWGADQPLLSDKDAALPCLADGLELPGS